MISFFRAFLMHLTKPLWCSLSGIYQVILLKRYVRAQSKATKSTKQR